MQLTTKLTVLTLGLALPLSIVSCKDAEKAADDAKAKVEQEAADAKTKADKMAADAKAKMEKAAADAKAKAAEVMANVPKSPAAVLGMFDTMNTTLESVTDLESAKKAIPALENAGSMVQKGMEAIGGEAKMEAALAAKPELMAKFGATMGTLKGHMDRIKAVSPEAYEFIDKKMDAIMK